MGTLASAQSPALLCSSPLQWAVWWSCLSVCSLPGVSDWWRASRFLPFWRSSEWGLRWKLRRAFPRHSYSHHCCSCSQSSPNIFPPRFRSLSHISWLVSPPFCSPLQSRSSHPGGVGSVTEEKPVLKWVNGTPLYVASLRLQKILKTMSKHFLESLVGSYSVKKFTFFLLNVSTFPNDSAYTRSLSSGCAVIHRQLHLQGEGAVCWDCHLSKWAVCRRRTASKRRCGGGIRKDKFWLVS